MSPSADAVAPPMLELDQQDRLPAQNQRSYVAMLAVQALNAFNDNFVKILLVTFAGVVAKGTALGNEMQLYLGAIFSLPYILFAPVAGWLSDRYSKQRVIIWMQVVQVVIFGCFHGALAVGDAQTTLLLSLACFFLLATQAAFFSPAKYGILKEIVGSRRLGSASGMLQMTNFVGILGGMGLAGIWFGSLLKGGTDAWTAANWLTLAVTIVAGVQIVGSFFIHRTPEHTEVKFHRGVCVEHFSHLKLLFSQRPLKLAALGVTYFWFTSYAVGAILVTLARELHPADEAARATELSAMPAMLGVGIMIGSVVAGIVCRRRIELGLVPLSGYFLAASLLWSGLTPVHPWIYAALIAIGIAGGAFMTPLYAFVQDRSRPEERARILSAMNLMDCVGGVIANLVLVKFMLGIGMTSAQQLLVLVPMTLGAALFITKLLPRPLMMLVVTAILRAMYRIQVHRADRMAKDGSLLVLPNHMSYADALLLGISTDRKVRFVLLESLYKLKSFQWFFKLFGTVPISATKAKEAIRTVGEALKEGEAVVLFPEGQLTRTGFLNEINKGYQLMARLGGDVRVQPVWLDGLWGSIFSFEGGRFFKKVPKAWPYRTGVWFGDSIPASEATPEKVREAMLALSSEAFLSRENVRQTPKLSLGSRTLEDGEARVAHVNALRLLETSLLREGDLVLCLLDPGHPVAKTFGVALPKLRGIAVCWAYDDLATALGRAKTDERRVILVGDASTLPDERLKSAGHDIVPVQALPQILAVSAASALTEDARPALYDEATGVLLTLSVPDPVMPHKQTGAQVGHKPRSLGHILPGLAAQSRTDGLYFLGLLPGNESTVHMPRVVLDDEGFVMPVSAAPPS
jgi:acyl-[acyl-carrier-protein]-phospholipid O-acyltransferase/long-chain-fatty-acid--[acyl-carrier-protein] ligase